MLDKNCLQLVFVECLTAELDELVANIRQHRRLRVNLFVLAAFSDDAALDVAEKPKTLRV